MGRNRIGMDESAQHGQHADELQESFDHGILPGTIIAWSPIGRIAGQADCHHPLELQLPDCDVRHSVLIGDDVPQSLHVALRRLARIKLVQPSLPLRRIGKMAFPVASEAMVRREHLMKGL